MLLCLLAVAGVSMLPPCNFLPQKYKTINSSPMGSKEHSYIESEGEIFVDVVMIREEKDKQQGINCLYH